MEKKRNPYLYVVLGAKASGKTYTTNKIIKQYCSGKNPKNVLILDINGEYTDYKTISPKHIELFSVHPRKEIRRIVPPSTMSLDDISIMLLDIVKRFTNGLILIEDINAYTSDHMPSDLIGTIIRLRHRSCDIILQFQGIQRLATPKILGNANQVRLHKTNDDCARYEDRFQSRFPIIKIAQTIVDNDFVYANMHPKDRNVLGTWVNLGGDRFEYKSCYVYVDFDSNKIKGSFSKQHFDKAIEDYIYNYEKLTIKPLLNRKDDSGKQLYTYKQAMELAKRNLYIQYYGNPDY